MDLLHQLRRDVAPGETLHRAQNPGPVFEILTRSNNTVEGNMTQILYGWQTVFGLSCFGLSLTPLKCVC
jgi:hypothetical protein